METDVPCLRIASKIERTERERKASKRERVLMVCN
jgi:hypothetical protein